MVVKLRYWIGTSKKKTKKRTMEDIFFLNQTKVNVTIDGNELHPLVCNRNSHRVLKTNNILLVLFTLDYNTIISFDR
jgi:hypothetical protein